MEPSVGPYRRRWLVCLLLGRLQCLSTPLRERSAFDDLDACLGGDLLGFSCDRGVCHQNPGVLLVQAEGDLSGQFMCQLRSHAACAAVLAFDRDQAASRIDRGEIDSLFPGYVPGLLHVRVVPCYQQIPAVDLELLPGHLVGIADCELGEERLAFPAAMNLPAPDVAVGQQCSNCDQDSQGQRPAVSCSVVYADRSEHEKGKQPARDQDEPGPLGDQGDVVLMSPFRGPAFGVARITQARTRISRGRDDKTVVRHSMFQRRIHGQQETRGTINFQSYKNSTLLTRSPPSLYTHCATII